CRCRACIREWPDRPDEPGQPATPWRDRGGARTASGRAGAARPSGRRPVSRVPAQHRGRSVPRAQRRRPSNADRVRADRRAAQARIRGPAFEIRFRRGYRASPSTRRGKRRYPLARQLAEVSGDIRIEAAKDRLIVRADGYGTGREAQGPRDAAALAFDLARWFIASGGVGPDG